MGPAFLVTGVFVASAEDMGREIGEQLAPELGDAITEGSAQSMEDALAMAEEAVGGFGSGSVEPPDQFPPAVPEMLGSDPVLDGYAQSCFEGDLGACDHLYYESPPMSDHEEYAGTCGSRVKLYAVMECIELE